MSSKQSKGPISSRRKRKAPTTSTQSEQPAKEPKTTDKQAVPPKKITSTKKDVQKKIGSSKTDVQKKRTKKTTRKSQQVLKIDTDTRKSFKKQQKRLSGSLFMNSTSFRNLAKGVILANPDYPQVEDKIKEGGNVKTGLF